MANRIGNFSLAVTAAVLAAASGRAATAAPVVSNPPQGKFQIARSRANGSANQLPSDSRFAARPSTSSELSMGYGQYLNYSQYINTGGYSEYSNYGEYSNSAA